jgi:predicted aspartyl protease
MGEVKVDILLRGPKGELKIKDVLVDTGATYSILNKESLKRVGAYYSGSRAVMLANNERIEAEMYQAGIAIGDRESPTLIVTFVNAVPLIGQFTLENLGLRVDPSTAKIESIREANVVYAI